MKRQLLVFTILAFILLLAVAGSGYAQEGGGNPPLAPDTTAVDASFTYQGSLLENGAPVNGICDFGFVLWDAANNGNQLGSNTRGGVAVEDGLFTVSLDFGAAAFEGEARWLEIEVDCGSGAFSLSPRQPLRAAPYALSLRPGAAISADQTDPALTLSNTDGYGLQVSSDNEDGVFVPSAGSDGLHVHSADDDGVQVTLADDDGVYVYEAGSPSNHSFSTAKNGFEVAGAEGNGLYVGRAYLNGVHVQTATYDGVLVDDAGDDGVQVLSADGDGVSVSEAGDAGVDVGLAGGDGVHVDHADLDGVHVQGAGAPSNADNPSDENNGFEVVGAEGNGLYVGQADIDGVHVHTANEDGVHVYEAGSPSNHSSSNDKNGFEVAGAQGNGLYVGHANLDGVRVHSANADGVYVNSAGNPSAYSSSPYKNGFEVVGAQGHGLYVGNADHDGVYVYVAHGDGVYAHTTATGHEWGFETPDKIYAGTGIVSNGPLLFVAQNGSNGSLETGDVVAVSGTGAPFGDGETPTPLVQRAGGSAPIFGVVYGRFVLSKEADVGEGDGGDQEDNLRAQSVEGPIAPGERLLVVVMGAARVKTASLAGDIFPGARLAMNGGGAIVGTALQAPTAADNGLIWALVNPH